MLSDFTRVILHWETCNDVAMQWDGCIQADRQTGACRMQMATRAQLTADIQRRRFTACLWASCTGTSADQRRRITHSTAPSHGVDPGPSEYRRGPSQSKRAFATVRETPCTGSWLSALSFP
jgi:hypothetical protein